MVGWNAVITVHDRGFAPACRLLETFGEVRKTEFFNILVMQTADPFHLLAHLQEALADNPAIATWISRFLPLERRFSFQSPQEFELRCREEVLDLLPRLAHARFHVRMHRRGFKGRLSSMDEERFLDEFVLDRLLETGAPGKVAFDDADAIIALETVGTQGGLSLFTKKHLARFTLLHLD